MFADHETSERRMSWRTERRINIFFMVRNTANIYREKGIVACNSERWSRLHLFPPSVFYSARSSESARSVRVFRSVSQQNSKDTTSRLRIAIITRASISDLGCKRHYTWGPIMHAIDSGHFVIFIPRSPTDARSLLSPDGRLCSVMIYSIFFSIPQLLSLSSRSFFPNASFPRSIYSPGLLIGETFPRVCADLASHRRPARCIFTRPRVPDTTITTVNSTDY